MVSCGICSSKGGGAWPTHIAACWRCCRPRQVGEVISVSGSRVRVDLVGERGRTCQGDAQVGGMVYVKGDSIVGQTVSLPYIIIQV
tara:strand:+ start:914 stop:1171 length:258 start_codon:yes stop_codon:yes gene_type:complete